MAQPSNVVDHPSHYQSKDGLEVIDVIDAFTSELPGDIGFAMGNAIKYILRWPDKNGIEDLNKAKWYINHIIKLIEKEERSHINGQV